MISQDNKISYNIINIKTNNQYYRITFNVCPVKHVKLFGNINVTKSGVVSCSYSINYDPLILSY